MNSSREIILISEETGERKAFPSINAAAVFIGSHFFHVQRAAITNGTLKGWRVYEGPDKIRKHIEELENQLKIIEKK